MADLEADRQTLDRIMGTARRDAGCRRQFAVDRDGQYRAHRRAAQAFWASRYPAGSRRRVVPAQPAAGSLRVHRLQARVAFRAVPAVIEPIPSLHAGELAAISLAQELKADPLLDPRRGWPQGRGRSPDSFNWNDRRARVRGRPGLARFAGGVFPREDDRFLEIARPARRTARAVLGQEVPVSGSGEANVPRSATLWWLLPPPLRPVPPAVGPRSCAP